MRSLFWIRETLRANANANANTNVTVNRRPLSIGNLTWSHGVSVGIDSRNRALGARANNQGCMITQ